MKKAIILVTVVLLLGIAGWLYVETDSLTYRNDEYRFEFIYPADWILEEHYDDENSRLHIYVVNSKNRATNLHLVVPVSQRIRSDGLEEIPLKNGVAYYGLNMNNATGDFDPLADLVSDKEIVLAYLSNWNDNNMDQEDFFKKFLSKFKFIR